MSNPGLFILKLRNFICILATGTCIVSVLVLLSPATEMVFNDDLSRKSLHY